ncbi:HAMP domain-containing methyl-accepting chemotaxis protein [Desulfotomaculum sp. 1211_IL3151]|uniref:HAMP domain-containing methyl-accepting chemotaxis protein n=1 Tax=Desulfotomaculum sp. 1211_IL3151 TaxID=3084055 RepID=UPI002FDB03F9
MKWYYNLKISVKLLIGFIIVALMAGIVGMVGVTNIRSVNTNYIDLYNNYGVPLSYAGDAGMDFIRVRASLRDIVLDRGSHNRQQYVDQIREYNQKIDVNLAKYEKTIQTDDARKEFENTRKLFEKFEPMQERIISLALANQEEQALVYMRGEPGQVAQEIDQSITILHSSKITVGKQRADELSALTSKTVATTIIVLVLAIVLAIALGIFISRLISKPIKKMVEAADKLAVGDIHVKVEARTKDEIGTLMQSFGKMVENIREQALVAEKIAAGDLTVQVKPKSENDILNKRFAEMLDTIRNLVSQINDAYQKQRLGELDALISIEQFNGAFKEVAEGVNEGYKLHIGNILKILDILSSYAEGDFSKVLERLPGKQALANEKMDLLRNNLMSLIEEMVKLSETAIEGQLSSRGDLTKFYGDYRKIVEGVNKTLDEVIKPITETAAILEQMAQGNFQVSVTGNYKGDYTVIKDAVNNLINSFNEVLGNINSSAEQVAAGAGQVSESSMALSQGAAEQASSVEQLTASLEEISSQTNQNAENANQANQLADTARLNAMQGNEQMQQMQKAMVEINDASGNISKIIKVIDEIAFQTNILALNAAVEAARAGQHGKGFAVVAEEVRNLAARSANAAKETTEMIEGSIKKVEDGTRIANATATALNNIVGDISKVANLVNDIAVASGEQATGISQVNQGVIQVSQVVQTNSATSEESAAASEELSSQAQVLKEMVSRFKLRKSSSSWNKLEELSPEVLRLLESLQEKKVAAASESNEPKLKIALSDSEFGKY